MGQAEVTLKYMDIHSVEDGGLGTGREGAYQSQIMQKQVKLAIVTALVDFDLPDLETVLDMLFTADNMVENRSVTTDTFK